MEKQYLNILFDILENGVCKENRTGIKTLSLFGKSIRHNYKDGFPLITTKKMFIKGIIGELLWFLKGTDDASFLIDNNIHIWDEWIQDTPNGRKLPHTYGVKWRNFDGVDQVQNIINQIKTDPDSRRLLVCAWDARHIKDAALPWCHVLWQINVTQDKYLHDPPNDGKNGDISIAVFQRSADFFLGVPFNYSSYSFLLYMIAELTNYRPKEMYYTFGDCHIYENHIEQCKLQLSRELLPLPGLKIVKKDNINDYDFGDFELINYKCHPSIKGEVAS